MSKTVILKALMADGTFAEYSEDVTDSWNEAAKRVQQDSPDMFALGFGMAETEENLTEIAARNSGIAERADFLEWRVVEIV